MLRETYRETTGTINSLTPLAMGIPSPLTTQPHPPPPQTQNGHAPKTLLILSKPCFKTTGVVSDAAMSSQDIVLLRGNVRCQMGTTTCLCPSHCRYCKEGHAGSHVTQYLSLTMTRAILHPYTECASCGCNYAWYCKSSHLPSGKQCLGFRWVR